MNNNTFNATNIAPDALIIQEVYLNYLYVLSSVSCITLLVYTTVLDLSREGRYLWLSPKPFSITTLLYALMRYGTLIFQILEFWTSFLSEGSVCNDLSNIGDAINLVANVSVQGILILRVYALCEGNRAIIGALIFLIMGNAITNLCSAVIFNGCSSSNLNTNSILLNSVSNIFLVLIELIVSSICLWKVWGTWRLKGKTGIRNKNDLVSVILRQVLSQFFFVIFSCGGSTIVNLIDLNDNAVSNVVIGLSVFQQSLAVILIAHFVLDLRQRNSAIIRTTDVTLPTLQFRNVMDYMHQSIMVEMSDHENENAVVDVVEGDNGDILPAGSPADIDVEVGCNKLESV